MMEIPRFVSRSTMSRARRSVVVVFALFVAGIVVVVPSPAGDAKKPQWKSLFDGKTLKNWKSTNFGGEADVTVEDGAILMDQGSNMTGITYAPGDFPKMNYEVAL